MYNGLPLQEIHPAAGHVTLSTGLYTFGGQNHGYILMYARYTEDTLDGSHLIFSCAEKVGLVESVECCERDRQTDSPCTVITYPDSPCTVITYLATLKISSTQLN
jgi:hypothetical protein